ncbi:MAG: ABC transporter substrate-binding protein [Candidatus Omnitrophica bacterium]|nr:ABC transporter substrate-binding protein [Candidatus Omnitrophota bacterium]
MSSVRRNFLICVAVAGFLVFAVNAHAASPKSRLSADALVAEVPSPQRIVSTNLCTDELLLQLVEPERVAAVTKFSADPEVSTVASQVKDIRKIQGGIEDVQACGPDLLLGGKYSHKETRRFFKRSGIPVLTFGVPKNFEDIYADIRKLSAEVGETDRGDRIIRSMQADLAALKPAPGIKKKAFFFQSGGLVPGSGTFENAIMEASGLENIAAIAGIRDYGSLSLEKMIEMKPDVLIFSSDQKEKPTVRGEVLNHPAIRKALPDVKTVILPSAVLNCGSPASVEAVRILVEETK